MIFCTQSSCQNKIIDIHWSSVKEFSCLKDIDFALEVGLKFCSIYMKSRLCSSLLFIKIFDIC
jgi:hypothetical protein